MDTALVKALENQATHELTAAIAYMAMANWCASEDYNGFSEFFQKQTAEELEHSGKIQKHLLERGELPLLGSIPAPKCKYESLQEIAKTALKMEIENSKGITAAYEVADKVKDYPSKIMLQWFITEQVEEEAWANAMVTQTERLTCAGATLDLDRHLAKLIGG
jgi:ferritin